MIGRAFVDEESGAGDRRVVIISNGFWRSHLGGRLDVLGSSVTLDENSYEVIGVMPPGVDYPAGGDIWLPMSASGLPADPPGRPNPQGRFWVTARLRSEITLTAAQTTLDDLFAAASETEPAFKGWAPTLSPVQDVVVGPVRRPLMLMLVAVGLVLVVACANVGSVLLARGITRRRELTVRSALGASRLRIARLLLTEALMVAGVGGALGVLIAAWGVPALVASAGEALPRAANVGINMRVLAASIALTVVTGLVAGVAPILFTLRGNPADALKDGSAGGGSGAWRARLGGGLIVAQFAISMTLTVGGLLLGISFARLMSVELGFDPSNVSIAQLQLPAKRYPDERQISMLGQQLVERLEAAHGVEAAAISTGLPLDGGSVGSIGVPGAPEVMHGPDVWITGVTPGYFDVLGIPLLRGRAIRSAEVETPDGIVVNEALARAYFPGQDPLGQSVRYYGNTTGRIVGIVGDTRQTGVRDAPAPQLYVPFGRETSPYLKVSVRTSGGGPATGNLLRQSVLVIDPALPVDQIGTLKASLALSTAQQRFSALLLLLFCATALSIACAGLYGLTAYAMSRRRREISIRLALGARPNTILGSFVSQALLLGAMGICLGAAGAFAGARLLVPYLYSISAEEPWVIAAAAGALILAVVAASYVPARRAARVDPALALKSE